MISAVRARAPQMPRRAPTMRAGSISGPRRADVRRVQVPALGATDVLIRLEGSGVCHSNLPMWEGRPWFAYPSDAGAPGHEGWGAVEAVGVDVRDVAPGQRVTALTYRAYAELDVAAASAVVPLPDSLAGRPMPGEPLGCAMNIVRRADIRVGQTVAIVGIGFLGALLARLATDAGARVLAISRRPFSLEIARAFGAAETIPMDDHQRIIDRVGSLTGGTMCDRVIEAVGQQWPLDLAGELTRERGRLIVAGFHQDGPRTVNMFLWNWRGLDVVNAHERDPAVYVQGMREAVDAIANGTLDPTPLLTHRYPLEELGRALDDTLARPDGFMKAVVVP